MSTSERTCTLDVLEIERRPGLRWFGQRRNNEYMRSRMLRLEVTSKEI